MGLSTYGAGMLLLAGALVVGVAGTAAMSASWDNANETAAGTGSGAPPVLDMGKDVQSSLAQLLPWVGAMGAVAALVGMFASIAIVRKRDRGARRGRGR